MGGAATGHVAMWEPDKRPPATGRRDHKGDNLGRGGCRVEQTFDGTPQNRRSTTRMKRPRRGETRRGRATFSRYSQEGNAPMMTHALTPDNPEEPLEGYELRVHESDYWWSNTELWHAEDAAIEAGQSCVYWFRGHGLLLYVGATQNPHRRWRQHANQKPWWREVWQIEQLVVPSHGIALQMEDEAIRVQRPYYNRTGPWSLQRKAVQRRGLESVLAELTANLGMPS